MAKLIGTSGHVDHGKTTLIRALTGIDADRLPEEKSRGMTIDLGFAFAEIPGHGRVSIVDVPGHERFLSNMLVGALGIDVALLCIAADAGVMPQSREHFQILELLPVQRMVVALTRSDLVGEVELKLAEEEVRALLAESRFAESPIVPVSAMTGEGIDALRTALGVALDSDSGRKDGPWYLPVDRAFSVKGHGTVVTGTLMRGEIQEGDTAFVLPAGLKTRVRRIQSHDEDRKAQEFGARTALNLAGIDPTEAARGTMIAAEGAAFATECLDLEVRWLEVPKHGARVRLSLGADEVMGRIFFSADDTTRAQFRAERPTAAALHQPFILRRYSPQDLLGGGRVLVPVAERRRRGDQAAFATAESEEERIFELVDGKTQGVATEVLCQRLGRTPQQLGQPLEHLKQAERLLGFAGLWFTPEAFDAAVEDLHDALGRLHLAQPTQSGVPRERALQEAGLHWSGKPLERILKHLADTFRLRMEGHLIAHPEHKVKLNPRQAELLDRVDALLQEAGYAPPSPRTIAELLHVPIQAAEQIVDVGVQAGRLVKIAPDVYYRVEEIETMKSVAKNWGGPFTAAEFRDKLGASRKYIIPLLELWDAQRFTIRQGDLRRVLEADSPKSSAE